MANRTIVFASSNPYKVHEANEIVEGHDIVFITPDKGFSPIEDGKTFIENAVCKARTAAKCEKRGYELFLADDSGLCVDFLNGEPGILSARYEETPQKRIDKLLKNMENVKNRRSHFACALVLCNKKGKILFETQGTCEGEIAKNTSGTNGFGYDPIFLPDGYKGQSMAELDENIKNKISHRGLAFQDFLKNFKNF